MEKTIGQKSTNLTSLCPPDANRLILVYGTLKKYANRNHNYGRLGTQRFIQTLWLSGYGLYDLGPFPAVSEAKGGVSVELHEVREWTYERIRAMEEGAGYWAKEVDTHLGPAILFVYPPHLAEQFPRMPDGVWI